MAFLIVSGLAVGVPFAVERFYLKHRFGVFALLFWLFVAQLLVLACSWIAARSGFAFDGLLAELGVVLAGTALLTLGFTPLAAVSVALVLLLAWAFGRRFTSAKGTE